MEELLLRAAKINQLPCRTHIEITPSQLLAETNTRLLKRRDKLCLLKDRKSLKDRKRIR
jgi:hypothetical protein